MSLLGLVCIAALISGLLIINYYSHRSLQESNNRRFQQNIEDRCRSISYFFSERENDMRTLAGSTAITGFFTNRGMGMTMAYGLRASLNNIDRLFEQRSAVSQLGGKPIYSQLLLLDENGSELSRWPEGALAKKQPVPEKVDIPSSEVLMTSHTGGFVAFTCPVYQNDRVQGFVRGWMHYATLVEYLLKDIPGSLVITDRNDIVFQAQSTPHLTKELLQTLVKGHPSPVKVNTISLTKTLHQDTSHSPLNIFYAAVTGYNAALYILENNSASEQQQHRLFFMAGLILLSVAVFATAVLIMRAGSKKLVLETSLALLAHAKEESDTIIRNFLDTLIVVNTDLKIIRVNQATCDLLKYSEAELIGKSVLELFYEDALHIQSVFAFYKEQNSQQSKSLRELRNVELCYRHRNGDRLPMSFNISLLYDDEGTVTGVVAGAKDVSNLRLALDKIARQKEYIETLFDIVPEGLLALSPSQEIIKHNRSFKQILHIWSERLKMTAEECATILIEKILAKQPVNETFIVHLKRDNATAFFRCSATVISVLEGITSVISIEDITDERKVEEERRLLATVIDQTGDSVIISGTDEVIQYVNPAALKNSGYSPQELIGTTLQTFRYSLLDAASMEELRYTVASGNVWHGQFKSPRKDGSIMEEDVTISPVRDEEGVLTHLVAIKRDITEMTNLQRQLLQAQKLEAIGQLAAGIAHEINTPMQYVQNNVTFLGQAFQDLRNLLVEIDKMERAVLSAETSALLASVDLDFLLQEIPDSIRETHDGINRVVKIVSAMKAFSHPGSNDKVATDLNHALESTITVCRNEWKYVAEMITDFDPDLPLVPCFSDQLNQVVLNLIINSSHAIQDHNKANAQNALGRITIATRRDGPWAEIQISDSGCGIPEEIQQRIFDPFFTTKEVGKGTGQGLAIAHDIVVNKHGGRIDFTSKPGQGATFFIRLPILSA